MRSTMKHLGWAVGIGAGAALCFAVRSRWLAPSNSRLPRLLKPPPDAISIGRTPQSELSRDLPGDAEVIFQPSTSPKLILEPASPPDETRSIPAELEMMEVQPPVLARIRRARITDWIVALSMLAIALACVYYVASRRKQPTAPDASDIKAMYAAMTQEALRIDQRPWVGLLRAIPQPLTLTGGGFAIKLYNSGKSPAFDIRITDVIRIEDLDQEPENPILDTDPVLIAGTLLPGAELSTNSWFRTSPETVTALRGGKVRTVNYMVVTYNDISHRSHTTQQCFSWHVGLDSPKACGGHDRAE